MAIMRKCSVAYFFCQIRRVPTISRGWPASLMRARLVVVCETQTVGTSLGR